RRLRLALRPGVPYVARRTQDAPRVGRGGWDGGGVRHTGGGGPARGRAAAVRVETAQLHPGCLRGGGRGGGAGAAARQRAALPRDAARAAGVAGAPGRAGARHRGGVRIGAPYLARVRLRGLVPLAVDPLDVVASVVRR